MDKRLIDADMLVRRLRNVEQALSLSDAYQSGRKQLAKELADEIDNRIYDPDPIPLPTIKPEDIIADLLFAFINQDADCPHDFEIQAVEAAVNYLNNHHQSDKYNPQLFESHLKQMLEVSHD